MQPERLPATMLAEVRRRAAENQDAQIRQVAAALEREVEEIETQLEKIVDRVEIRITRSLSVCRYLRDELESGRIPTIRSVFETGRQDHTEDPVVIAGVVVFRQEREGSVFGANLEMMDVEDRPKYGFAWFEGTPTEPLPFGPVCFLPNLESD